MPKGKYKHTPEHNLKISKARMGRGNGQYLASKNRTAIHIYMRRRIPKPQLCQNCGKVPPRDLANISQKYMRVTWDWKWLCRNCHMEEDGRKENLIKFDKERKGIKYSSPKPCIKCGILTKNYGLGLCTKCYEKKRWEKRKYTYQYENCYLERKNKK
jgi:hypothetical protein